MTDFLHLENKLYITVTFKDKYTRIGFCKIGTDGIFRGVCHGVRNWRGDHSTVGAMYKVTHDLF